MGEAGGVTRAVLRSRLPHGHARRPCADEALVLTGSAEDDRPLRPRPRPTVAFASAANAGNEGR